MKAGQVRLNCRLSFQKLDQAKKSPSLSDPGSQCFAVNFKSLTSFITQIYRLLKPLNALTVPDSFRAGQCVKKWLTRHYVNQYEFGTILPHKRYLHKRAVLHLKRESTRPKGIAISRTQIPDASVRRYDGYAGVVVLEQHGFK